jgi:hypothetical protein
MGGTVSNMMQPSLDSFGYQMRQQEFNNQLGRASNQMYQPPSQMGGYDPYTAMRRPNYMPYGPNQQFYQPIYQPSYSQFSNFGYGQAPFGGFYQPPMMGMMGRQMGFGRGLQMGGQRMGMAPGGMDTNYGDFDSRFAPQQPNMFGGQATYLTNQFQPMLSPRPMQTQYRPIPMASQTSIDQLMSKARAEGASEAQMAAQNAASNSGFKKGGGVEDDGIASLLKK